MTHRQTCGGIVALFKQPMTQRELMEVSGYSQSVVSLTLKLLMEQEEAHISEWVVLAHHRGQSTAVYAPGPGINAPRKVQTQRERMLKYRSKHDKTIKYADPHHPLVHEALFGRLQA